MLHIKYMLHLYITGYIDFVYIFIISVYLFDLAYRYSQERTHALYICCILHFAHVIQLSLSFVYLVTFFPEVIEHLHFCSLFQSSQQPPEIYNIIYMCQ